MQVSAPSESQASDRPAPSRSSRASASGTTKTFVLAPNELTYVSSALDATPNRHELAWNLTIENEQLRVGDRLISIGGQEVLDASGQDVKNLLQLSMQNSETKLVFLSFCAGSSLRRSSTAIPKENRASGLQEEDPPTEMEEDGEWRPVTAADVAARAEKDRRESSRRESQLQEKRSSVSLRVQSTTVCLDVKHDPQCADAIKWGFDAEGAFLKRFSSKATPAVETLRQLLREGARLRSINGNEVSNKSKDEIIEVWDAAFARGPLELSFNAT